MAEKPNTETFPLSSKEEENQKNEIKTDNGDIHQLKAQSIRLSNLSGMVESLQSQVKQLEETIRLRKQKKTSSIRKRLLLVMVPKQKRRQKEEGTQEAGKMKSNTLEIETCR